MIQPAVGIYIIILQEILLKKCT